MGFVTHLETGEAGYPIRLFSPRFRVTIGFLFSSSERGLRVYRTVLCVLFGCGFLFVAQSASAQIWIEWQDATATNLSAAPAVGANDVEEKDYVVGDFDQDGDNDVICVRKLPFTTFGNRTNVLFMNVSGVLTDQTAALCPDFATADNARDVMTGDFDGDGWTDFVVANAGNDTSNGQQPRIFMNLGVNGANDWLGFQEQASRLPVLLSGSGSEPNACAVGVGDLTGNNVDDLYLVDYLNDLEDRLLINDGTGNFSDQTSTRIPSGFVQSAFATAGLIADVNADGFPDIIKNTTPSIRVAYNDGTGNFSTTQDLSVAAAYHFDVGDLNNDGRNDFFIVQDGQDQYMFNDSPPGTAPVNWNQVPLTNSPLTTGFGGNVHIEDLDGDGAQDVVIADTDTDVPNCTSRRMAFLQSNGVMPNPTLIDPYQCNSGGGAGCEMIHQQGVYDVAIADFNGDGALDMLVGHCTGTDLYFQVPPVPPVLPIESFTCGQDVLNVALSWSNPQAYDSIEVRRDGVAIATLGGGDTSYTDVNPGAGEYAYSLVPSAGGLDATPVSCLALVSTVNAVSDFTCVQFDEDVQLNWTNNGGIAGGDYDSVQISRNGVLIAILPGTATSYLDAAPALGATLYVAEAVISPDFSGPTICSINVASTDARDLVLDFSQDDAGATNSARELAGALEANGRIVNLVSLNSVLDLPALNIDMNDFERVWVELGTSPNNKLLLAAEGQALADFVTDGIGGSDLYLSGNDFFFFAPQTPVHDLVGATGLSDGSGSIANVLGLAGATCDLSSFTQKPFSGESDTVDRLQGTTGEEILRANNGGNEFVTAVYTDVPNGGTIILQTCEFGGIGAPHDRQDLMDLYLNCFPSGFPPPVASFTVSPSPAVGTAPLAVTFSNTSTGTFDSATWLFGDGGLGIGDTVLHTYTDEGSYSVTLSVDGPSGADIITLTDIVQVIPDGVQFIRGDVNNDGSVNIADAIGALDYLFSNGPVTCLSAVDANDDGGTDVADAIAILGYLFSSNGDLSAPFPGCGLEATIDTLTCISSFCP